MFIRRMMFVASMLSLATLAACGDDKTTSPTPVGTPVSITAGASTKTTTAYSPNPVTILRGTAVTWMNTDTVAHTSTSDSSVFDSGTIAPGASFTFTFQNTGNFAYHCTIHPGMVGTVTVQ